ncbi:M13 family metallopeptidase [Altererythrobacter sp. TH136]|uniref:M13 family metallopeptidase n=1 Tax=Altererythrobacter sp. TH136 TaxID=2067415 RepID=UPI00116313A2|nr:M13 family metallopeptidase [Altererythrobacter sp. TH136]QDM39678.1 M13 family metallopeptidase [Altererythrobacter sp. TH136]
MTSFKSMLAAATALGLSLAAAPALAQNTSADDNEQIVVTGQAAIGDYGLDLTTRDLSARPGDDFERYASGAWIDRTDIPADRASTGSFVDLGERSQEQVRDLVTAQSAAQTKYGMLYRTFLDEAAVERAGVAPLMQDIARVRAIGDKTEFARFMGSTYDKFGTTLFGGGPYADTGNPEMNVLWFGQSGLGLPERDYYFNPQFAKQRAAYQDYIERTFRAIGVANPAVSAQEVLAFETYVAQLSWPIADRRDIGKINNPMSSAQLAAYAPGIDWNAYFQGAGIPPQDRIIVNENTAIKALAELYASTDLDTLKLWEQFHVAHQASPYLNKRMVDSRFAFTSTLSGVSEQQPRWKRAITNVNTSLGELVGEAYVAEYFPAVAKTRMEELVRNLKLAMADRIRGNDWMGAATKDAALEKLEKMQVMVGNPDEFRNFDGLQVSPTSLYDNVRNATKFNADYAMSDLGKPVDKKKWVMNPQTVNAYNGGLENKMVFPAGILQPPFFDPYADPAVNYGAIGVVIGHEISHGFDDQGRKIDANGAVRDWWTPQDSARFEKEAKVFGDQYAKYEAVPGAFVNPELTMGENIADLAGVLVAYDAYHKSLGGKEAPVIDGLTGDQRFFLAYAQVWRSKAREDDLRSQVTTDPHSPERFRTIGPLRNVDAWYAAFDVKPGDKNYIPPEQRARIW